ncbi:GvpL/GvpF family gas vesicle protein [Salipaludibacillus sp. CUR1]|uniref:GvpL/GvpF family gas vesicle protein n=1 Tax=Salipaludibacillus sp. CUR1 TaxID=2820003 RepID=UPI001E4BD414|nr:GvpL/GvpF family gas vesicle protein [Salipaludibacillus sp. CUR1]MCE7793267.1 GvpL/GvpF family gas vesicle protein [Salipaludibacillus sp. CUR1]
MTTPETNELIYVYAFVPADEASKEKLGQLKGIDPQHEIDFYITEGLAAVICKVSADDFSEDNFKRNVEDMKWLQERAYHHHELMNRLHQVFTVLPLKFGTIYEHNERLSEVMKTYNSQMKVILEEVKGKEEWNLKVFADRDVFSKSVLENNQVIEEKKREISNLSKGKQFFARKKLDQFINDEIQAHIKRKTETIHEELKKLSKNAEVKKNWDQKITGREDDMAWNCVYLLETGDDVNSFKQILRSYQEKSDEENEGLRFESTGPWPAYHFANFKSKSPKVES